MRGPIHPEVRLLQAAADPARLEILRQLATADTICACDFTDCCGVTQPTVSHHLKVLREAGWVLSERRGNSIVYRLDPLALQRFRAIGSALESLGGSTAVIAEERQAHPRRTRLPVIQSGA